MGQSDIDAVCTTGFIRLLRAIFLKAFAFGEFLSFINACGIDPSGRQSRSNAKAFVLRQKKETKEKATPDRSKSRNKINDLRRWRNSQFANVELLKHSRWSPRD